MRIVLFKGEPVWVGNGRKARIRRQQGLLRPRRCPYCRQYTKQVRVADLSKNMLRGLMKHLTRSQRKCLTCKRTWRDRMAYAWRAHEARFKVRGGRVRV